MKMRQRDNWTDTLIASSLKWHSVQGIPTFPELLKRAEALEMTLRHMAYFEPKTGGVLSLGLARLAAGLKVGLKCTVMGLVQTAPFVQCWICRWIGVGD